MKEKRKRTRHNFIKDDFELISFGFPGTEDIHIYVIGDVHCGSAEFAEAEFRAYIRHILSDPAGYCVLVGDLIDNGTKSSKTSVYEEVLTPCEQIEEISLLLKPLADAGRILCTVEGNHERRTRSDAGTDAGLQIADNLGIRNVYRRRLAVVQIRTGTESPSHSSRFCYYLAVTHGAGAGNSIKKELDYVNSFEGADVLVTGHTHKPKVVPSVVKRIDRNKVKIEDAQKYAITCSSWLHYGGYGVEKMYSPTPSCVRQMITLGGKTRSIKVLM